METIHKIILSLFKKSKSLSLLINAVNLSTKLSLQRLAQMAPNWTCRRFIQSLHEVPLNNAQKHYDTP